MGGVWGLGAAVLHLTFFDAGLELGYLVKGVTAVAAVPVFVGGIVGAFWVVRRPRMSAYAQGAAGVIGGALTFYLGFPGAVALLVAALLAFVGSLPSRGPDLTG